MAENNNQNSKYDLDNKYQDLEGLTEKKLKIGLWYVEHVRLLRFLLIIFLVLIAALSWSLTLYSFGDYIFKGMGEDESLIRQLIQTKAVDHGYISQIAPADLNYYPVNVIKSGDKKYDFVAQVANANKKHWGDFEYYFIVNGKELKTSKEFILPEESLYLMALGEEFDSQPFGAQLVVKNMAWRRLDAHQFPDWEGFKNEHSNISVSNIELIPGRVSGLSEKVNLGHLKFNAVNKTAYNYLDVNFNILLYAGPNLVGVNKYTLSRLMSGENKQIGISWPDVSEGVSETSVIPRINFMADSSYVKYEGGIGEEK